METGYTEEDGRSGVLASTRPGGGLETVELRPGQWTESALKVLRERYLRRNGREVLESPEGMFWRVGTAVAQAETQWGRGESEVLRIARDFYDLMVDGFFLPNSPTLMNAGKGNGLQYSACYVLPVGDSMEEIFEAVKRAALIHKSGGGTGFAFSRLRPKDSVVSSTGGKASGPVSFLRVFNGATEAVKQGGTRRGANMGILRVDHPDVLEFIDSKLDGGITNFNISVTATDVFMQAVLHDTEYDLVAPHTGQVVGRLRAREVFDRIIKAAWRTGDPGMIFIDRINAGGANPTPELNAVEATNPCGEQPLYPNEACNLGSLNLAKFVRRGRPANGRGEIAWDGLERATRLCVRFLDDVITVNPYPLPEVDEAVKANRRIGLGVMGWADLLFELGIPYDSEQALALGDEIMRTIQRVGHDESVRLGKERGPFPNWSRSIYRDGPPLRNATVTTIAPTGTISIIAGCSSGIEPIFALAFSHIVGDRHLTFFNPVFERLAREHGFWSEALMAEVARQGTVRGCAGVPAEWQRVFVTAHEITPEWHVRHQGAFQQHTDNGVSKTINLPHSATAEDVARAYLLAYEVGCYGITVFRDGCKADQVLHVGTEAKAEVVEATGDGHGNGTAQARVAALPVELAREAASEQVPAPAGHGAKKPARIPRPRFVQGVTYRAATPLGTAYITVNQNEAGEPFEVFANVGKAGSDTAAVSEAIGRLISLCLRMASPLSSRDRVRHIVDQLAGIGGGRPLGYGRDRVRSLPDAIAQVLAEHVGLAPAMGNGQP
ncbi:MAG: vitamin B12-dependent ribonucleotide reductase, partial [Deltaproteobacteria bacterium]|nr:vitamin B12-dependent ribonucleotide reductase [Deltaproteobacteria bacterium]